MKKVEGKFAPSKTEIEKAKAYARAIARKAAYDGNVEIWFDAALGNFRFHEHVGNGYVASDDPESYRFIDGYRFTQNGTIFEYET